MRPRVIVVETSRKTLTSITQNIGFELMKGPSAWKHTLSKFLSKIPLFGTADKPKCMIEELFQLSPSNWVGSECSGTMPLLQQCSKGSIKKRIVRRTCAGAICFVIANRPDERR